MGQGDSIQRRLTELEARVSALEKNTTHRPSTAATSSSSADPTNIVTVTVQNKRFEPENYDAGRHQDQIWFDCSFLGQDLARPARAIKGTLEFCDLFGEPQFRIGYTLNEAIDPNKTVFVPGLGFEYDEFIDEHQWMLGTALGDMTVRFRISQVLYQDGSNETLT